MVWESSFGLSPADWAQRLCSQEHYATLLPIDLVTDVRSRFQQHNMRPIFALTRLNLTIEER